MRISRIAPFILIGVLIVIGGYLGYEYVKRKPPTWLTEIVAQKPEPPPLPQGDQAPLTVPEGFTATIFARDVKGARVMVRDQSGTMLLSQTKEGKVVALPDRDGNGVADEVVTILQGLDRPHGLAVICDGVECTLYVAEEGALKSYAYDADAYEAALIDTIATFPTDGGHYTRTLLEHPDGRLLVSVGSSCNVCTEKNPLRATIQAIDLGTHALSTFASGLRNTVFMALHPVNGELWGTDNGRDLIGDEVPPDEINIIKEGQAYGWPVCYGNNVYDTDFEARDKKDCEGFTPPHIELPAHGAALGLGFIPEEGWPEEWYHDLIVALHGSWNRSEPAGYKVVRIDLDAQGRYQGMNDLVTGFLPEGKSTREVLGRPAGILVEPGGVFYISDDHAGAVYRVTRTVGVE